MNPEREKFLNLKHPPARLNIEETAWFLGFAPHDVPILIQAGMLKPLGRPPSRGTKYFATATLEQLRTDLKWLARASDAIVEHWRRKNEAVEDEELAEGTSDTVGNGSTANGRVAIESACGISVSKQTTNKPNENYSH